MNQKNLNYKDSPEYREYLANKRAALEAIVSEINWNMRFLKRVGKISNSYKHNTDKFLKMACKVVETSIRVRMLMGRYEMINAQPFNKFPKGGLNVYPGGDEFMRINEKGNIEIIKNGKSE